MKIGACTYRLRMVSPGAVALLVLCVSAVMAHAQTFISGRVLDDLTHAAVPSATVTLMTESGRRVARVVADGSGYFVVEARGRGFYRLHAQRIGYTGVTTPRFEVEANAGVEVEIRLKVDAVLLTPLEIVGRTQAERNPTLAGFYYRKQRGMGHFITRDEIRDRNAQHVADLLLTVPGVRMRPGRRGGGWMIYMGRAIAGADGACPSQVFVDGILMNRRIRRVRPGVGASPAARSFDEDTDFTLDEIVSPTILEGIEVYSGISSVPAEFVNADSRCGVVLIWTRRGV